MATAINEEILTLPAIAIRLGLSLDWVRREFGRVPELTALAQRAGQTRFIRAADLEKVKRLLEEQK